MRTMMSPRKRSSETTREAAPASPRTALAPMAVVALDDTMMDMGKLLREAGSPVRRRRGTMVSPDILCVANFGRRLSQVKFEGDSRNQKDCALSARAFTW